ncbi:hypothetical protein PFISCL1PPCAC_4555 [Pristionchus fissidentatus]|uniref:MARVEL domain-containing protein n=1 Tax=Pristionchus fissidentatus TaxID=1538716 RepID=A0AAV5V4S0_9BILA|nr:hypothetical protein PFISCL1PPCAC_4555 [Pristionchus fissidentatus]
MSVKDYDSASFVSHSELSFDSRHPPEVHRSMVAKTSPATGNAPAKAPSAYYSCSTCHSKHAIQWFAFFRFVATVAAFLMLIFTKTDSSKELTNSDLRSFFLELSVHIVNILITALLWAGAFATSKNCLPIYCILEIIFYCSFSYHLLTANEDVKNSGAVPVIGIGLFVVLGFYCAFFIPRVVNKYYQYIHVKDRRRRREAV